MTVVAARTCTLPSTSTRTDDGTTPTESAPANPSLLKSSTREMLWSTSGHASASAPAPASSAVVQLADGRYTATNWLGWSTRLCALAATALVVVVVLLLLLLLRVLATAAAAVVVVAPAAVVVEAGEVALRHGSSAQARVSASPSSPATHAAPPVAAYVRTSNVRVCDEFAPHTQ